LCEFNFRRLNWSAIAHGPVERKEVLAGDRFRRKRPVIPNLPGFDVSPERYDTMLGKPFRTWSAHIVTLGPIRVAGGRDKLDASSLDAKHALAE